MEEFLNFMFCWVMGTIALTSFIALLFLVGAFLLWDVTILNVFITHIFTIFRWMLVVVLIFGCMGVGE